MKNLAPQIYRQRLIIEGIYNTNLSLLKIRTFMKELSGEMKMTVIYGPIVKNIAGKINPFHAGFEGILIWAESGASVYTWENQKFFTMDIYTCKKFSVKKAVDFTRKFFNAKKIEYKSV